jgi:hypothetical protein
MKLTTGIVALAITVGTAAAQNPATILQNTKNALQDVAQQQTAASNAALQGTATKPSAATATKPGAAIPAKPATASGQTAAKPTTVPAKVSAAPAKPVAVAAKPVVVPAKTAANSPATLKPASASASSSNVKIAPPKASQATPGSTAHKDQAKPAPAASSGPKVVPAKTAPAANSNVKVVPTKAAAPAPAAKPAVAASKPVITTTPANDKPAAVKPTANADAAKADKPEEKEKERKYSMTGKRDPFISPVVDRQSGSGCSTGKKCLDIEQIALHGVVKSENGMIAVVTNALNKAYFLRENDPVFNGYVLKINVDSIVFKQNFQDRLGKPFTKDVVKRITTPAV